MPTTTAHQNRSFAFPKRLHDPALEQEIPKIRAEAERIPGVTLVHVVDDGPRDEIQTYVTFNVAGKGTIVFYSPTRESFFGTGRVTIAAVAECQLVITSAPPAYLQYATINDAIQDIDQIYQNVRRAASAEDSPVRPKCN